MEASSPETTEPARPVVYFAALIFASLVGAAHEVFARQVGAYLAASGGPRPGLAVAVGGGALLGGALLAWRAKGPPRDLVPWLLASTAVTMIASAPAWFLAFTHAASLALVATALPALIGTLAGASAVSAWRSLARPLATLGAVETLLRPFRLLGLALALGISATAATLIGPWRSAAAVGMALATAAGWCAPLFFYLDGRPLAAARSSRLASIAIFAVGLMTFAAAELVVPMTELAAFDGDIVHTRQSSSRRWTATNAQGQFSLFADGMLVMNTLDAHRYYEGLVHPVLCAAPKRERVLLFGMGHGLAEREVLRHADVRELRSVVTDRAAESLARTLPFLAKHAVPAYADGRLRIVEKEPFGWLEENAGTFDVVIIDLPDPTSYFEAKNYTRLFYTRLATRLAPGAVGVVQATSPFATPRSHGSIEASLAAAGFHTLAYHAPLPTLGVWGFILFSRHALERPQGPIVQNLGWLTARGLTAAFARAPDVTSPAHVEPNLLHAQHVVALLDEERTR